MSSGKSIYDIMAGLEPLVERRNELPLAEFNEAHYAIKMVSKAVTANIKTIDPEVRVTLCDWQDKLMERAIQAPRSYEAKNVYTPAIHAYRRWKNVELMKDKGLAGYLLAKKIQGQATMYFCTKAEDYPYLSDLPDMQLLFSDEKSGLPEVYYEHLLRDYQKMDVLVLHGMYIETIPYLNEYRKLRPDGKVYCGLDMNSWWMQTTIWDNPQVHQFFNQCDFVATSCRMLRDALNRNPSVNFSCRFLPNGFYNSTGSKVTADSKVKENTILTVGRIGTPQKNNDEMLIAFARVAHKLPNWKLKLVGTIEPEYNSTINEYFSLVPSLKDRVIFTGPIFDKAKLSEEYAKAKIFILSSTEEGGTPNVYAEALFHGCMFITSSIDGADDITNFNELGYKYKIGDTAALEKVMVKLCNNATQADFDVHIPKALDYANRYFDWGTNIDKLALELFG